MLQVVTFRSDDPKGKAAVACYYSCGFKYGTQVEVAGPIWPEVVSAAQAKKEKNRCLAGYRHAIKHIIVERWF